MSTESFARGITAQAQQILLHSGDFVIFGTMSMGRIAHKTLTTLGKRVVCFCDNDPAKQGGMIEGVPILAPAELAQRFAHAAVVVCSYNKESIAQISQQLMQLGFFEVIAPQPMLYLYWFRLIRRDIEEQQFFDCIEQLYACEGAVVLRNAGLMITERCTLRCRDCGSLIPHYEHPQNYPIEQILQSLHATAGAVDAIESLGIFGGEPFLHPQLIPICKAALEAGNIKTVNIVTNGTIVPDAHTLEQIAALGIIVTISDYAEHSKKLPELVGALMRCGAVYEVFEQSSVWYQAALPKPYHRAPEINRQYYRNCFIAKKCPLIQNGFLYLCGYHASAVCTGAYVQDNECIDLLHSPSADIRAKLEALYQLDCLKICDYCLLAEKKETPRGVQG